ncbi:MAG: hypothetical protein AMXMBFR64_50320 [Myxococcales bacterium]
MTRQQKWSVEAHKYVLAKKEDGAKAKYNTFCRKMPSIIQQGGLVQALVFVLARGGDVGKGFVGDLAKTYGAAGEDALLKRAQDAELADYLALSRDLIDVAVWFRRFAQIELGDEEA